MMSIEDYVFSGDIYPAKVLSANEVAVVLETKDKPWMALDKGDAIALAKHFNLTAHDIECTEYKALCADLNQVDEDHFDELVEIQANKIKSNKSIN